ncbi:hypothetical protein BVRB_6g141150 [Beta vulgaris subsp. vulgaris]|nr:hypothetical protein BVRB_6g141150 [Beta vulgaris subsp. vulgaris]
MATSSTSKHKQLHLVITIFVILIISSCAAARTANMMVASPRTTTHSFVLKHLRRTHDTVARRLVFNFLPKGRRIPPSGPSKRHNSVVDSVHN